jgi:hypothetical protein
MDVHGSERDQRLSCTALGDYGCSTRLAPTLDDTHDCQDLRRERRAPELFDKG